MEHRCLEELVYDGKFFGSTDEYSRPMGTELSLLNPIYLKNFRTRPSGFNVFDQHRIWKKKVRKNQVINPPFSMLEHLVPQLLDWCNYNNNFLVMICPYKPFESWWECLETMHVPVLLLDQELSYLYRHRHYIGSSHFQTCLVFLGTLKRKIL